MDLWIRSQDRLALTIVKRLRIIKTEKKRFEIVNYDSADMLQELGEYSSEERAIEVLDEINYIKWYKYMAELSWNDFIKIINDKTQSEKIKLFSNMNTYVMPIE